MIFDKHNSLGMRDFMDQLPVELEALYVVIRDFRITANARKRVPLCHATQCRQRYRVKHLLRQALTDRIDDRDLYMKGIDVSYFYEGYSEFRTGDL